MSQGRHEDGLERLMKLLESRDRRSRIRGAAALRDIPQLTFVRDRKRPHSLGRFLTVADLIPKGRRGALVDRLLGMMTDNHADVRENAAGTLSILWPAVPARRRSRIAGRLLALACDPDRRVRAAAVRSLLWLRYGSPANLWESVRDRILELAGQLEPLEAILVLQDIVLHDKSLSPGVRGELLNHVLELSWNDDRIARSSAALSMAWMRQGTSEAQRRIIVDRLVQLLRDPDESVAKSAAAALVDMRGMIPSDQLATVRRAVAAHGPWWAPRLLRIDPGESPDT